MVPEVRNAYEGGEAGDIVQAEVGWDAGPVPW